MFPPPCLDGESQEWSIKGLSLAPIKVEGKTPADFSDNKQGMKRPESTKHRAAKVHLNAPRFHCKFEDAENGTGWSQRCTTSTLWKEQSFSYSLLAAVSHRLPFWGTSEPVQPSKLKCRSQITMQVIWFYLPFTSGFSLSKGRLMCNGM